MKKRVTAVMKKNRQFILYSIIGFSGFFIDFGAFFLMVHVLQWNIYFSNIMSAFLGMTNNFLLNLNYNFKTTDDFWLRYLSYCGVAGLGMVMSSIIIFCGVEILLWNVFLVKLLAIGLIVVILFNLNKRITFSGNVKKLRFKKR